MDDADDLLVARGQAGDRGALAELIRRHQGMVYGVAYRLLGSPEEAEDVAQEAFIQVLTRLRTVQDPAAFTGWLRRVTVNLCLDRQRRGARIQLEPLAPDLALPDPERGPEARVLGGEHRSELEQGLLALPVPYRQVVVLRDVEGLAYHEMAALLRVPEGTIKSRLSAGRRLLRAWLRRGPLQGGNPEEQAHAHS